jgi:hypothetical protein
VELIGNRAPTVLGALGRVEDARDLAATFQSGEASAGGSFSPRRDRSTRCFFYGLESTGSVCSAASCAVERGSALEASAAPI